MFWFYFIALQPWIAQAFHSPIPSFMERIPFEPQNSTYICGVAANSGTHYPKEALEAEGSCDNYIFPPLLEMQHGVNGHLIQKNKNRPVYKQIINFDCTQTGANPATEYNFHRVPQGYKIIPSKFDRPRMIEALIDPIDFRFVANKAQKINVGFIDAFMRSGGHTRKVQDDRFGNYKDGPYDPYPVRHIFFEAFCVEAFGNFHLSEKFINDFLDLPSSWDPMKYTEFLIEHGRAIGKRVCYGGELFIYTQGLLRKTNGGYGTPTEADLIQNIDHRIINKLIKDVKTNGRVGSVYTNLHMDDNWHLKADPYNEWFYNAQMFPSALRYEEVIPLSNLVYPLDSQKASFLKLATDFFDTNSLLRKAMFLIKHVPPNPEWDDIFERLNEEKYLLCPHAELLTWLKGFTGDYLE